MKVQFISNIKKEYPTMIRIVIFKQPNYYLAPENNIKRHKSQVGEDYEPTVTSLKRTKTVIRDLVLANNFDIFATFTFDPRKISDRFSYTACYHKFQVWIHNQLLKSPELKYLAIPERHKNGAWHFHVLMANYNGSLKMSCHRSSSGREIYNITSYRSGFSTACKIDDVETVSNYVMKYITKDFIRDFNQRRFTCSRNLSRPVRTTNVKIDFTLPHRKVYENENMEMFEFPLPSY